MRIIEANPEMSRLEITSELVVSLAGVNYQICALVERVFLKADSFRKSNANSAYLYVLRPKGVPEKTALASAFFGRKLMEKETLREKIGSLKYEIGLGDTVK